MTIQEFPGYIYIYIWEAIIIKLGEELRIKISEVHGRCIYLLIEAAM